MDLDNQILEMFKEKGMWIEFGAQFSAKGQIAQLLDVVKPILTDLEKEKSEKQALLYALKRASVRLSDPKDKVVLIKKGVDLAISDVE